jgi:hypothetical protein
VGVSYIIAISLGHTELDWPYISDTGDSYDYGRD